MSIKNVLLIVAGFIMLGFGAVGLLLPVWPTTPFLIVSAACFSCAPKLRKRLEKIPFFGEHVKNYRNKTGLSKKTVTFSMLFLWGMLITSCLMMRNTWSTALLFGVGIGVSIHIIYMSKARRVGHEE